MPNVVTQLCPEQELNPRPVDRKSNALPIAPPRHLVVLVVIVVAAAAAVIKTVITIDEASTHQSTMTHTGNVFCRWLTAEKLHARKSRCSAAASAAGK